MKYRSIFLSVVLGALVTSCFDDKGNYDYTEVDDITIVLPTTQISAISKAENLKISPKVISKFEGEISADNPNYEFSYYYSKKAPDNDYYLPSLLDSAMVKDLDIPASMDANLYTAWFHVKDRRTGITTSAEFKINVLTATTMGFLVMSEEGANKRVRIDMIGDLGDGREAMQRDIFDWLPDMHGANQLHMENQTLVNSQYPTLSIHTDDNSYRIWSYSGQFSKTDYSENKGSEFAKKVDEIFVAEASNYSYNHALITKNGDVYHRAGTTAMYDFKVNVDVPFTEPTYKVAPFIGAIWDIWAGEVVFYDKTNKKFKYCAGATLYTNGAKYLRDPDEPKADSKLFDWTTGKDMVYMSGTDQQPGIVYALLTKDGKYSIYGIEAMMDNYDESISQYYYIDNVVAPGIENATCFAFDPKMPFLMYNNGSDIYLYDMATQLAHKVASVPGETITMLKYCFISTRGCGTGGRGIYSQKAFDYMFRLAVGSSDPSAASGSEGKLRFYDVPEFAGDLTQYGETYTGFGRIKDIAYKQR